MIIRIFNRAILTLILLFFLTSCDDKSGKSSSHANSSDNLISSQYPEIPTVYSQSFGQQCVFAINEIDAHALRSNRVDTILTIGEQEKTPLTYWYDSNGIMKICLLYTSRCV